MDVIGIDLGYGETKVICPDGSRIKFPSRWKMHDNESWGFGGMVSVLSLDGGQRFTFGDAAIGENTREPLGDGRLSDRDSLPLLAAALWSSGVGKEGGSSNVVLGSGTPLGRFHLEASGAKATLANRSFVIESKDNESREIKISQLVMRPQGVGAALHLLDRGLIHQEIGYGLIIDIGSRTTDVLTVNLTDMEPVVDMSFSMQEGVGNAVASMNRLIARETGYTAPSDVALSALVREVAYRQRVVGGGEKARPILDVLAGKIVDKIRTTMRGELDRVTALVPVGGGSRLIGDDLEILAPGTLVEVEEEDKQFANALGYYDAAKRSMNTAYS
ncbi:Archaeal actin-like protein [uncultured archaeon]|nr:Archaeal actin-like protein [uncultured archaeon]